MSKGAKGRISHHQSYHTRERVRTNCTQTKSRIRRPAVAHRQRGQEGGNSPPFTAPETWHEPKNIAESIRFIVEDPGEGYIHPITVHEARERIALLPAKYLQGLEVVQFSRMTKKRAFFPCYGMQWGSAVYLYPIEDSYEEVYDMPPTPQQRIDARMYGGRWVYERPYWILRWTKDTIRDFYLNSVLIHEIGHVHDDKNRRSKDRERYADWFAIEFGYRISRKRR